jgi:energy-coupling factor transporter ATP-binding protein EcfA2
MRPERRTLRLVRSECGLFHDSRDPTNPELLIVYVHGIFGSAKGTWKRMARMVAQELGFEADVLLVDYPAKLHQRTDLNLCVQRLANALEKPYADARHIVFIVHSLGGLVVKKALCDAAASLLVKIKSKPKDFDELSSLWLKTRAVVNIGVPHRGGERSLSSFAQRNYGRFYRLGGWFLHCARVLSRGKLDWGRNALIEALRTDNPELLLLEEDLHRWTKYYTDLGISRPAQVDLVGESDIDIERSECERNPETEVPGAAALKKVRLFEREYLVLPGCHTTSKVPRSPRSPVVAITIEILRKYARVHDLRVAERSQARLLRIDKSAASLKLIQDKSGKSAGGPAHPTNAGLIGSQQHILDTLRGVVHAKSGSPELVVLTGPAGVGKSTVLRLLAGELCGDYLSKTSTVAPLPIFVPLQQIREEELKSFKYGGDASSLWSTLSTYWCCWATRLSGGSPFDYGWIEGRLRREPTVLILDGLDEFLQDVGAVDFNDFIEMVRLLKARFSDNDALRIVVGVRNSQLGYQRIAESRREILEIKTLERAQAVDFVRETQGDSRGAILEEVLARIRDPALFELVYTPMILELIGPQLERLLAEPLTMTLLLDTALRSILVGSSLPDNRGSPSIDDYLDLLSLIAWSFADESRGELSVVQLTADAGARFEVWRAYTERTGQVEDSKRLLGAFGLAQDQKVLLAVLNRTVFLPTREEAYRFAHRLWEEHLAARYFASVIRFRHMRALVNRGYYTVLFQQAAEHLASVPVTLEMVTEALKETKGNQDRFIIGNFGGFLANSSATIEGPAIRAILQAFSGMERVARHVFLGGLCYRASKAEDGDVTARELLDALFDLLPEFCSPGGPRSVDRVTASMCWCFLDELSQRHGRPRPTNPWPGLDGPDAELDGVLMVAGEQGGDWLVTAQHRSLQRAFVLVQYEVLRKESRKIGAVHYLFMICAAKKRRLHTADVAIALPEFLDEGKPVARAYVAPTSSDEVRTVFERCQELGR